MKEKKKNMRLRKGGCRRLFCDCLITAIVLLSFRYDAEPALSESREVLARLFGSHYRFFVFLNNHGDVPLFRRANIPLKAGYFFMGRIIQ